MIKPLLFWTVVALDAAALGLMFVLGLAAAQPSHTSPLAVVGFFALPALLLLALVAVFLRVPWPLARTAALVVAAAPVLLVVGGAVVSNGVARLYGGSADGLAQADPAVQQRLMTAIAQGDEATAVQIATAHAQRIDPAPALVAAIGRMEQGPGRLAMLQALLQAGLEPHAGGVPTPPLEAAISASGRIGAEPVRLLLAAGADPNFSRATGPVWFAALSHHADPAMLPMLLDHDANLAALDMAGGNALKWAAFHENWAAALLLVERGAAWRDVRFDGLRSVQQVMDERHRARPGDMQLARLARLLHGAQGS